MSKGKTFSITVPVPLFTQIEDGAAELGISRSKFVYNILQGHINKSEENAHESYQTCKKKNHLNICSFYEHECPWKPERMFECSQFKENKDDEEGEKD